MIFTSDMKIGNYWGKELEEIMIYENDQNYILEQKYCEIYCFVQ